MGKFTISMAIFHSYVSHYQRVRVLFLGILMHFIPSPSAVAAQDLRSEPINGLVSGPWGPWSSRTAGSQMLQDKAPSDTAWPQKDRKTQSHNIINLIRIVMNTHLTHVCNFSIRFYLWKAVAAYKFHPTSSFAGVAAWGPQPSRLGTWNWSLVVTTVTWNHHFIENLVDI